VTEHNDLDCQVGALGPLQSEDLHDPEEGEIEERESHGPFSRSQPLRRKSQLNVPDEVLGTHRHAFIQNLWGGHYEFGMDARPGMTLAAAFDELALVV
jgi:hypothetical protein